MGAAAVTAFRPGDRLRCLVSTADALRGRELLGTLGAVGGDELVVDDQLSIPVAQLRAAWEGGLLQDA